MNYDGHIDITRRKRSLGIQYKHESKEDIAGFISKPVARPEYGTIYQHKGMLLQNLHRRYLYVTSVVFESKDDPTQMTKVVIYNYILYYIQKTIHFELICTNVHS